ncbi:MAG TPA: DUF1361 domain-containing protein [Thermoanaerobaculia bacterium]|nr:DUF1361 domain-containing protein [Thermoanaerobaculia bacterium]
MKRFAAFAFLLVWCVLLIVGRVLRSGTVSYVFLVWNLFLAVIPVFAAWRLARAKTTLAQILWFAMWLAFLPNAPYIATDFLHLRARPLIPLWYDVALLFSCAATGLLFAFSSIADVQRVVAKRFGAAASWLCSSLALVLCGFGIYIGRYLRWNSWDVATNPRAVLGDILARIVDPLSHPRTLGVTLVYGCGLLVGYVAFHLLAPAAAEPRVNRV